MKSYKINENTELKMTWNKNTSQYGSGEYLTINGIQFASFGWNSSRTQGTHNNNDWSCRVSLPGYLKDFHDDDIEKLKERTEAIVLAWFKKVLK
jgi:hypothetical protein